MNDGIDALRFNADGYDGEGTFDLQEYRGHGHDRQCKLEVQLTEHRNKLTAIVNMLMVPAAVRNRDCPSTTR